MGNNSSVSSASSVHSGSSSGSDSAMDIRTTSSRAGQKLLAITAVSRVLRIKKSQIMTLRDTLADYAHEDDDKVHYEDFVDALLKARIVREQVLEVFKLIFTVWDTVGDERIGYRDFVVGISPLACPRDNLEGILRFALHVNDVELKGVANSDDVYNVLCSIDTTASFFGDSPLKKKNINRVTKRIFTNECEELVHKECAQLLVKDPLIQRFATGKTRVQFKDDLVQEFGREPVQSSNSSYFSFSQWFTTDNSGSTRTRPETSFSNRW